MRLSALGVWAVFVLGGCDDSLRSTQRLDFDGDGVDGALDCDDSNPEVYPGATELCDDGIDNDCNGAIDDEGIGAATWYADTDRDGFGDGEVVRFACPSAVDEAWSTTPGDCDDTDPKVYPGAVEVCDGFDQNCDGEADDGLPFVDYYADVDGDGFGSDTVAPESFCKDTDGYVTNNDDCDDGTPLVYPGAPEVCDGIDNDCDDGIDDLGAASVGSTVYATFTDAVTAALQTASARVDVCPGLHPTALAANLANGQDIEIVGQGRQGTTLRYEGGFSWMSVRSAARLAIRGVTVSGFENLGTAAQLFPGATLEVRDSTIKDLANGIVGLTLPSGVTIDVDGTEFSSLTGSAIRLEGQATLAVTNSTFDGNDNGPNPTEALLHVAPASGSVPSVTIQDTVFTDNRGVGGLLWLASSKDDPEIVATLTNVSFLDSQVDATGVIRLDSSRLNGTNVVVREIMGQGGARGLYANASFASGIEIEGGRADEGAGVYAVDGSLLEALNVHDNEGEIGGGVYLSESTLRDSTVSGNTASGEGGGVRILAMSTGNPSRLENCDVSANTAVKGGGIYVDGEGPDAQVLDALTQVHANSASDKGPGIFVQSGSVTSEANFGGGKNDNGAFDLAYTDADDEVQEVDLLAQAWQIELGNFFFVSP